MSQEERNKELYRELETKVEEAGLDFIERWLGNFEHNVLSHDNKEYWIVSCRDGTNDCECCFHGDLTLALMVNNDHRRMNNALLKRIDNAYEYSGEWLQKINNDLLGKFGIPWTFCFKDLPIMLRHDVKQVMYIRPKALDCKYNTEFDYNWEEKKFDWFTWHSAYRLPRSLLVRLMHYFMRTNTRELEYVH